MDIINAIQITGSLATIDLVLWSIKHRGLEVTIEEMQKASNGTFGVSDAHDATFNTTAFKQMLEFYTDSQTHKELKPSDDSFPTT